MSLFIQSFVHSARPPAKMGAIQYMEGNIKLVSSRKDPTLYKRDSNRPFHECTESFCCGLDNKEHVMIAPTGAGKSNFLELVMTRNAAQDPGPSLAVSSTKENIRDLIFPRLLPVMKACKDVASKFLSGRGMHREGEFRFSDHWLWYGGASPKKLQGKSCRWLYGDELWQWIKGSLEQFRRRSHDIWNSRILLVSQASRIKSEWHEAWLITDQRECFFKCDKCGNELHDDFVTEQLSVSEEGKYKLFRWDKTACEDLHNVDFKKLGDTLGLHCPHCDRIWRNNPMDKTAISDNAYYKPMNPSPKPNHIGWRFSFLMLPETDWYTVIEEYVTALRAMESTGNSIPYEAILTKRFSQFFGAIAENKIEDLVSGSYSLSDYEKGEVWEHEATRFLTIDLGKNHFWWIARSWSQLGGSRLIGLGRVDADEKQLGKAMNIIRAQYRVKPKLASLDSHWDKETARRIAAEFGFITSVGAGGNKQEWDHIEYKDNGNGTFTQHTFKRRYSKLEEVEIDNVLVFRVSFAPNYFKDTLQFIRARKEPKWETPENVDERYPLHLKSEIQTLNEKGNRIWVPATTNPQNHWLDCEVQQVRYAAMFDLVRMANPPSEPPKIVVASSGVITDTTEEW